MDRKIVDKEVKKIVGQIIGLQPELIIDSDDLVANFICSKYSLYDIFSALEGIFQIRIPIYLNGETQTIGQISKYIYFVLIFNGL